MSIDIKGNIISSSKLTSTGVFKTTIVRDGLVLCLDAGNQDSYSGAGNTWYDLSGNGNHYTFGSGIAWNSAGYFDCTGGVFTGPASNVFGFNTYCENYVEAFVQVTSASGNVFFSWYATPNTGTDGRAIFSHLYYSNGNTYYDVAGCCGGTQRISYPNDTDLTTGIRCVSYMTKMKGYPNRQIFKNLISQVDSTTNDTATVSWNNTAPSIIANSWSGKLYTFKAYNRYLEPYEMAENFQAQRARFSL